MKLKTIWASALALLTLAACSQEDIAPPSASEAPKTKQVYIDLTAGQDSKDLRVTYGLDSEGRTTGLQMSDKNVILRVAVRRASGEVTVQDLEFVKTADRNHATYSGQLTVPADGSGEYTIAAVLVKEAGTDGKVYGRDFSDGDAAMEPSRRREAIVNFDATRIISHDTRTIEANMPYVSQWQSIVINGTVAEPVTLQMKPFGTLLRIRIKNESTSERTFRSIRLTTNAMAPSVQFDLSRVRDTYPYWSSSNTENIYLPISGSVTVAPSAFSPWMYVVVYPRKTSSALVTVGAVDPVVSGQANFQKAFRTTLPLPHGSVPMTLAYTGEHGANFGDLIEYDEWGASTTRPKLAIEYVATHSLNQAGNALVTDHLTDNANIGRFTMAEAAAFPNPIVIGGINYYVPTRDDMVSIFPHRIDPLSGAQVENTRLALTNFFEPNVKIGTVTRNYLSDYSKLNNTAGAPLYGLRFKRTNNCTAYRYRAVSIDGTTSKGLLVECIYIGLNEDITIADVAQESFWSTHSGEIVARTFPFYGEKYDPAGTIQAFNLAGSYWTTTQHDPTAVYVVITGGGAHSFAHVTLKSDRSILPIIPFMRD